MALINCPECGCEISDKAEACIRCGFPLKKATISNLLIKAEKYPSNDFKSFMISIMDLDGEEIAVLHTGTAVSIPITREMSIYARYKHSPLSEKCKSNTVTIQPDGEIRLQISYQRSLLLNKLYIHSVDCIDSE